MGKIVSYSWATVLQCFCESRYNSVMDHPTNITIRIATSKDAAQIVEIYGHYVLNSAVTFDTEVPSLEYMQDKIEDVTKTYPYLVAEADGEIVGFTYAAAFRPRAAYIHAVETSIYTKKDFKRRGLGRRLYSALESFLVIQNVYTANACIAYAEPLDEFLSSTSPAFHWKLGYQYCGKIPSCGRKFNRWYDIIWMQKTLKPLSSTPDPFIAFSQLSEEAIENILTKA